MWVRCVSIGIGFLMMAEGVDRYLGTSAADRSEEEAEEFLPGFTSLEDYSKVIDFIQVNFGQSHASCHLVDIQPQ